MLSVNILPFKFLSEANPSIFSPVNKLRYMVPRPLPRPTSLYSIHNYVEQCATRNHVINYKLT